MKVRKPAEREGTAPQLDWKAVEQALEDYVQRNRQKPPTQELQNKRRRLLEALAKRISSEPSESSKS